jgi:hypothetical protein
MAVVNGPLHSSQASGAIGGLSYSEDGYGHTCKSNIYPNDPRSTESSQERAFVQQYCAFQFGNISQQNYDEWVEFSERNVWKNRLGGVIKLTPQQWFMRSCIPARLYFGESAVTNPPEPSIRFTPNFAAAWTVNGIELSFDENPSADQVIVVWQVRNLLATQVKNKILKRSHVITYPSTSPVLITGAVSAFNDPPGFPFLLNNTFCNIKIRTYSINGLPSPELRYRIHVIN